MSLKNVTTFEWCDWFGVYKPDVDVWWTVLVVYKQVTYINQSASFVPGLDRFCTYNVILLESVISTDDIHTQILVLTISVDFFLATAWYTFDHTDTSNQRIHWWCVPASHLGTLGSSMGGHCSALFPLAVWRCQECYTIQTAWLWIAKALSQWKGQSLARLQGWVPLASICFLSPVSWTTISQQPCVAGGKSLYEWPCSSIGSPYKTTTLHPFLRP